MLTQLSEKVLTLQSPYTGAAEHLNPNPQKSLKVLIAFPSAHSFLFADTAPTVEAKLCLRTKQPLLLSTNHLFTCSTGRRDSRVAGLPFAGVHLFSLRALLAFDVAAPAHLALAGPGHLSTLSVMASAAADGITVLILVALAGCRARRVLAGSTKTGWVLNVEQVHSARNLIIKAR